MRIALCHTLRRGKGLPGLAGFAQIVSRVKEGELAPLRAKQEIRTLVRAHEGSQHAKMLGDATDRMLASLMAGEPASLDTSLALADRLCGDLLDHHLYQFVEFDLVGGDRRFDTRSDALTWVETCRNEVRNDQLAIARKLVGDQAAERLRAPARRRQQRSTADLLYQGLGTAA
jgi:hypothetical protein